jgi:hypothetical protein
MKKTTEHAAPELGAESTKRPPPPPPNPSARFQRRQRELRGLIKQGHTLWNGTSTSEGRRSLRENGRQRLEVVESLRDEFAAAFGFTKDEHRRAERFCWKLTGMRHWPLFDHLDYYQRGSNLVIVSQPYGLAEEELLALAKSHGAVAWAVVDEWAHYYPGHATCLYVEFERWTPKRWRAWIKGQREGGAR